MPLQRTGPVAPAKFQSLASQGKFSDQSALRIMRTLRAGYKDPQNTNDDSGDAVAPDPNSTDASAPGIGLPDTSQLASRAPRSLFHRGGGGRRRSVADDGTPAAPSDMDTPASLTPPSTGLTRAMASSATASAPLASNDAPASSNPPQQTEGANPLTGDGNSQPEDTSSPVGPSVNPGRAMGFSSRGASLPKGDDIATANDEDDPDKLPHVGGSGALTRKFSNPTSANVYSTFVKGLFGGDGAASGADSDYT